MTNELIETINSLFLKRPNTIYEVRIVNVVYKHTVNIFFEWYKIGYATKSRQIARFNEMTKDQLDELVARIKKETKLTVVLDGF